MECFMNFAFQLNYKDLEDCYNFSDQYKEKARKNRSGGTDQRSKDKIMIDTYKGKIGEVFGCDLFKQLGIDSTPDYKIYEKGEWDIADILYNKHTIQIKTIQSHESYLLVETKHPILFDYYVLIRLNETWTVGNVLGWATQKDILSATITKKGEILEGKECCLDAENYTIHMSQLRKSELLGEWQQLKNLLQI
jgi:hypothetical protein